MSNYLFFDNASTTRCCNAAVEAVKHFAEEDFGNPSSSHVLGKRSAKAIHQARDFFAKTFEVSPAQVIFTGSGSESDNLAIYGIAMQALANRHATGSPATPRVLVSSIEHPAVRKTALSLTSLGFEVELIPVDSQGQIDREAFLKLLTPQTVLVSIQRVNNIIGSLLPVEELAQLAKKRVPSVVFHTDAVQAFGRVDVPKSPSAVDLLSISAHKVEGPKGVGALIVLNPQLIKEGLRPVIWGGDQEGGFRSGTQNAGLISGFHLAAKETLERRESYTPYIQKLRDQLKTLLNEHGLLAGPKNVSGPVVWNSPVDELAGVPYIVNISLPGLPAGLIANMLEERHCVVSTGSACSSNKAAPDPVLTAIGLPTAFRSSAIRISFSCQNQPKDVEQLAHALKESIEQLTNMLSGGNTAAAV